MQYFQLIVGERHKLVYSWILFASNWYMSNKLYEGLNFEEEVGKFEKFEIFN